MSYFDEFADFEQEPTASLATEFARLASSQGWKKGTKTWKNKRQTCMETEFAHHVAVDNRLANWQSLCKEVGIDPIPESITKCKKQLKKVHVNLVDLIDARRAGTGKVRRFRNAKDLADYTRKSGKTFPKVKAKHDGYISILLRHVWN